MMKYTSDGQPDVLFARLSLHAMNSKSAYKIVYIYSWFILFIFFHFKIDGILMGHLSFDQKKNFKSAGSFNAH